MSHPNAKQLFEFSHGLLDQDVSIEIAQHVARCKPCCNSMASAGGHGDSMTCDLLPGHGAHNHDLTADANVVDKLQRHPRYELISLLGQGGMGSVYKARHRLMNRIVALKVIRPQYVANPVAIERFHREVRAAGRLSHRNIVTAYDAERYDDLHFLIMEFVDGVVGDQLICANRPLAASTACELIQQVAQGLQHAHEQGTVHRDIKPQNLMAMRDGIIKILDFGLARFAIDHCPSYISAFAAGITTPNDVLGTPDYVAPEQVSDSRSADIRADIYSLGCTLYFFLSGQPPFPESSAIEKLLDHISSTPRPLNEIRGDLPVNLSPVVEKMMAKDPEQRYQTPEDVVHALGPFITPSARPAAVRLGGPDRVEQSPIVEEKVSGSKTRMPRRRQWMVLLGAATVSAIGSFYGLPLLRPYLESQGGENLNLLSNQQSKPILFVLPSEGVWWADYVPVRSEIERLGHRVIAAAEQYDVRGFGEFESDRYVRADMLLHDVQAEDFDGVVFAGGEMAELTGGGSTARQVRGFIGQMLEEDKIVAAICIGQMVLADGGFLQGQRVAKNEMVASDYPHSGALWISQGVVTSGQFVTAAEPEQASQFAETLVGTIRSNH